MAARQGAEPGPNWERLPAQQLIAFYLDWAKENRGERTYGFYREHLLSFADSIEAKLKVWDVKPFHVSAWLRKSYSTNRRTGRPISDTHKQNAVRSVKRCFKWAADEGYISHSPLAKVKGFPSRRRETYLTPDQFDRLLTEIRDNEFRELVLLMRLTGCRPQEARSAEARHVDAINRCLDFPREESKGQRDRRVILLTDDAFEIIERRVERYPRGPLFRNRRGIEWTKDAVIQRFKHISARVNFSVSAYSIRHAWATDALAKGVPIQFVAKLMGHKGTRMLMEVYNDLELKKDELRHALNIATGSTRG
jgi:integrase